MKERFDTTRQDVLAKTQEYLQAHMKQQVISEEDLAAYRANITEFIGSGDFTEALQRLEKLRDAKTGIILHEIKKSDGTPILIRDARWCNIPAVRETEAFEMQYLNAIRAAMDIAEIEEKPKLKADLQEKAEKFAETFHAKSGLSQKELAKNLEEGVDELGELIGSYEIGDAYTKLNIAKDFQNFKDIHADIVTVSSINYNKKIHTVIEAEIAFKELTKRQKEDYQAIINGENTPVWYNKMPYWEKILVKRYAGMIIDSRHVIPTQLRQINGMKNAFEKDTAIVHMISGKPELEILHASKHAGTLASLARDKDSRQEITEQNAAQAQEWIGKDRTLHCNTFNSGPIGAGADPEIVRRTTEAMKEIRGRETNTAFNSFRLFSGANDFSGAKNMLANLSLSFGNDPEFKVIKSHINAVNRGWISRIMGINKPRGNVEAEIANLLASGKIGAETVIIIRDAIALGKNITAADVPLRPFGDSKNLSLQISTQLNNLSLKIAKATENPEFKGLNLPKIPKETILNMCASGKDRTGLAEHDQSVQAIAGKIGAADKDLDRQLLAAGHTAEQAGGIHAGGATIGCFGTKGENKAGIPKERSEGLQSIVEASAASNKIKGKGLKVDELTPQAVEIRVAQASVYVPKTKSNAPNLNINKNLKGAITKIKDELKPQSTAKLTNDAKTSKAKALKKLAARNATNKRSILL